MVWCLLLEAGSRKCGYSGLAPRSSFTSVHQMPLHPDRLSSHAVPGPVLNADGSQGAYMS